MKKALIIIPTYNEADNILKLIKEIFLQSFDTVIVNILIIDDNSADGTASLVRNISDIRVHIIERPSKIQIPKQKEIAWHYRKDWKQYIKR